MPAGGPNTSWEGYRTLTAAAIDGLAEKIVEQVKARGPFLSLADFVNRRLVDNSTTASDERYAGALKAALDDYDVDTTVATSDCINLRAPFQLDATSISNNTPVGLWDINLMQGGPTSAWPRSSCSAFAPGYLTQADILNAIGPVLTVRSDTFVIRAYGDVQNPVTGEVSGRAWCEAVVQRLPEFVAGGEAATTWPVTQADSKAFGRRYRILSFRWLGHDDI